MVGCGQAVQLAVADNGRLDGRGVFQSFDQAYPVLILSGGNDDVFIIIAERFEKQVISIGFALLIIENVIGFGVPPGRTFLPDSGFKSGAAFAKVYFGFAEQVSEVCRAFVKDFAPALRLLL